MQLVNIIAQIVIPLMLSVIGAYLGTLFGGTNNILTIYWVISVMAIGLLNVYTVNSYNQTKNELESTKGKLSSLLIKKEIKSSGFDIAIYPRLVNDQMQFKNNNNVQIFINSVHPTTNLPNLEIKSSKKLKLEINSREIIPSEHLDKYIYLIPERDLTHVYSSKRFFLFETIINPLEKGVFDLEIISESKEFRAETKYSFQCN
jgi:hypothetical protein